MIYIRQVVKKKVYLLTATFVVILIHLLTAKITKDLFLLTAKINKIIF